MVDTLSTLSAEAQTFFDRDLLHRAKASQVFYDAGQKRNLLKRQGNSISWRRFNALTAATTPLTEGTTPSATSLSLTEVTATVAQYGAFVEISDMLDLTGVDPVIAESIEVLGQQAGESIETVIADTIKAGTSVIYATGSSRVEQSASNPLTVALLRKAVRTLDANNTMRFNGGANNSRVGFGAYVAFVHPNAVYDLQNDSEWQAMQANAPEKLFNGEIGSIMGCRIVQTTLAPVFTGEGAASADVYGTIIVGQHAFGVVDVAGTGKFQTIVKQLGSSGTADPLNQRGTVGWKSQFVSKILNNNFMVRIEAGVSA